MRIALITGSGGLIGSQAARRFSQIHDKVIGLDNDMRSYFFGKEASTSWAVQELVDQLPNYEHRRVDIRERATVDQLLEELGSDVVTIVHTAAQPSHDWAAREPFTDFDVNAGGTLNLLEAARQHAPDATFIFTSTNKVYGDESNRLPLVELENRFELDASHAWHEFGIPETLTVDNSTHSLFGASKLAADVFVQEYGRYFGMNTGIFRGGCLTGPGHSGTQLHGFLAYLMQCTVVGAPYTVIGYKGKQVRDNIHSEDLIEAFVHFDRAPRQGEAYNIGGGRFANCSMLEAIEICERLSGNKLQWTYDDQNRIGDHMWWVSDIRKFQSHYPDWNLKYDIEGILTDMQDRAADRWLAQHG